MATIDNSIATEIDNFQAMLTSGLLLEASETDNDDIDLETNGEDSEDSNEDKKVEAPTVVEKAAKQVETVKAEDDEDTEDTVYSDFANELVSKGIIGESKGIKDVNDLFVAVENTVKGRTEKYVNSLHPYVGKLNAYIEAGGLAEDFLRSEHRQYDDYRTDDEFTQTWLIRELKIKQGADEEEINEVIEAYKTKGTLEAKAKLAQTKLIELSNKQIDADIKVQADKKAENDRQAKERLSEINSHIDTLSTLLGKQVSITEKNRLKDFMFTVRANGKTDWQTSLESGTVAERKSKLVTAAYIALNGYGLGVIDKKNKTEQVSAFEQRLAGGGSKQNGKSKGSDYDLDL